MFIFDVQKNINTFCNIFLTKSYISMNYYAAYDKFVQQKSILNFWYCCFVACEFI